MTTNTTTEHAPTAIDATNPHSAAAVAAIARALTDDLRWCETATHYHEPTDDPAECEPGAWRYVATVRPDESTTIDDFECYGSVVWQRRRWGGHTERPDGFTGAARVISRDVLGDTWWEPYREGRKVYNDPATVRNVTRLIEEGFHGITLVIEELTRWHADDGRGNRLERLEWREVGSASLWGIDDSGENADGNTTWDYRAEVIGQLIEEAVSEVIADQ